MTGSRQLPERPRLPGEVPEDTECLTSQYARFCCLLGCGQVGKPAPRWGIQSNRAACVGRSASSRANRAGNVDRGTRWARMRVVTAHLPALSAGDASGHWDTPKNHTEWAWLSCRTFGHSPAVALEKLHALPLTGSFPCCFCSVACRALLRSVLDSLWVGLIIERGARAAVVGKRLADTRYTMGSRFRC